MNGMTPRPMKVVAHFRVVNGTLGAILANDTRDKAQILLIVKPGIMTEAKACQTNVSKAAIPILDEAPSVFPSVFLAWKNKTDLYDDENWKEGRSFSKNDEKLPLDGCILVSWRLLLEISKASD